MALPLKIKDGMPLWKRGFALITAGAAGGVLFLQTPWGQPYDPGISEISAHFSFPIGFFGLCALLMGLFLARSHWTIDDTGVTEEIHGVFGRRRRFVPVSDIVAVGLNDPYIEETRTYFLRIDLVSGKQLSIRLTRKAHVAQAMLQQVQDAFGL